MPSKNPKIVSALNEVLTAELTAINQYFVHAEMCENWGYERLSREMKAHSIHEMKHAEALIERVLFLDGVPNVQRLGKINLGENVKEMLECDMALENEAIPRLKELIEVCYDEHDHVSRALLEQVLKDEEEHLDWLDAQLTQIEQMGLGNYLATIVKGDD